MKIAADIVGINGRARAVLSAAGDVDSSGNLEYLEGSASDSFVRSFTRQVTTTHLKPGVSARDVIAAMRERKAIISDIVRAADGRTWDQARAAGVEPPYFWGFFDSSERTLKNELGEVAASMGSIDRLKTLKGLVDGAKNSSGKVTFEAWTQSLYAQITVQLGLRPRVLLHGNTMGGL